VTTERIEAVFLTTHNWGKAAKFFQTLGFTLDFETDHNSGNDKIGLALLAPDQDWRRRGDMDPQLSRPFRASIVALALHRGPGRGRGQPRKYVILGAGLDSFAQRKPDIASHLVMFEIDHPGARRPGNVSASSNSASASRAGCASCRSISRRGNPGGTRS
jgi:Leucine carboxyl methyltransferase